MNIDRINRIKVGVTGARACFRRPEFKSDLITYDVMPPTVARQILAAVLGATGWSLETIIVRQPIQFGWDRLATSRGEKRARVLIDVDYVIEAATDRSVKLAPVRETPIHLGLSNYPGSISVLADSPADSHFQEKTIDFGWMIYDTRPPQPCFFRAIMAGGVIDIRRSEVLLAS